MTHKLDINILRRLALMQHLDEPYFIAEIDGVAKAYVGEKTENQSEWVEVQPLDSSDFNTDYRVLTDEEADEAVKEEIENSVWAFKAEFILYECDLPLELAPAIQTFQEEKCESANEAILELIEKTCGLDEFVESAISADGRGHFLSSYDGDEYEETVEGTTFYIYRNN